MSLVLEMIERSSMKHANLIHKITEPLQTHFGISYFCYQFISNDGHWVTLGNHPEWLSYSAENEFYRHDPSLVSANQYTENAYLVRTHQHDLFQKTLIEHAVEKFEIDHCLMLIKPNPHGCEHYFFAASRHNYNVMNTYISQFSRFNKDYTHYVREKLQPIRNQLMETAIDLKAINPERYFSSEHLLNMRDGMSDDMAFGHALTSSSQPLLTVRETQCLTLYRQGFTAKQTAKKLGLSFRTIEDYFEKIKQKYNVQSKQELLFIP